MPDRTSHAQFLPVLATAIVGIVNTPDVVIEMPEIPTPQERCAFWAIDADETVCTEIYSTMRVWNGEPLNYLPAWINVQISTVGKDAVETLRRAELIARALVDDEGDGRCQWVIGTAPNQWVVVDIPEVTTPRSIGKDGQGRSEVVFDFECVFRPA